MGSTSPTAAPTMTALSPEQLAELDDDQDDGDAVDVSG
jgi:hypothetical protein